MADRMEALYNRILDVINEHGLKSICDYGCGEGELLEYLKSKKPELELYGIDFFAKYEIGEESDHYKRIDRESDEFETLPGSRKFDLVVSTFALHHFQFPVKELRTIAGMIRPGGFLDMFDHCFDREGEGAVARSLSSLIGEATSALRGMYHRHHYTLQEASDLILVMPGEVVLQEEFRLEVSEEEQRESARKHNERTRRGIEKIKANWPEFWKSIFVPLMEHDYNTIEAYGIDPSKMFNIVMKIDRQDPNR